MHRAEFAQRMGCNLETVRYYEQIGLLPKPPRTDAGHRIYGAVQERRLQFVLKARDLGFSLSAIRSLLRIVDENDQPCDAVRSIAVAHLEDIRARITDLARIERALSDVAAQCGASTSADCPIIEALFR